MSDAESPIVNQWLVLYDDGKTPRVYDELVRTTGNMSDVIAYMGREQGVTPAMIWCCVLTNSLDQAAACIAHYTRWRRIELDPLISDG